MITTYAEERLNLLSEELELFEEMGIPKAQILTGKLNAIRNSLLDIKEQLKKEPFISKEDEIHFFKYIKPKFTSAYIFELEHFKIESERPVVTSDLLENYYRQELLYCNRFFEKHRYHYQYFLYDGSELDDVYFIRSAPVTNILLIEYDNADPGFSTTADYLFGKFLAYEKLQDLLLNKITNPMDDSVGSSALKLKWTGDKSNLVELAYGIWLTHQINNGGVTLVQIIRWLELSFDISIGNAQKQFANIKNRKRLSLTKFIDQMRDNILKKIDDDYSR